MIYTTTSCRNCGFKTRSRESNVPNVQIGCPILICPQCRHLILDTIIAEYEFMTDKEQKSFSIGSIKTKGYFGGILYMIMGYLFIIAGIATGGDGIIAASILGLIFIIFGGYQIIKTSKVQEDIIEQAIYESLKRTQNVDYVKFIEEVYKKNKIKRIYRPFRDKTALMEKYKDYEFSELYILHMKDFDELFEMSKNGVTVEKNKAKSTNQKE